VNQDVDVLAIALKLSTEPINLLLVEEIGLIATAAAIRTGFFCDLLQGLQAPTY
jgi:hypothetical protein